MVSTLKKVGVGFLVFSALSLVTPALTAAGQSLLVRVVDRVLAFETDRWTQFVPAGSHRLEVEGDGDTDLDCFVVDSRGRVLGSDTDSTDYCVVTWYQYTGQRVSVRIENLGRVYNQYELRLW